MREEQHKVRSIQDTRYTKGVVKMKYTFSNDLLSALTDDFIEWAEERAQKLWSEFTDSDVDYYQTIYNKALIKSIRNNIE